MKRWQLWILRLFGVDVLIALATEPFRVLQERTNISVQEQIDNLRRLSVVQEKPRQTVHARTFRQVREFVGDRED